MSETEKHKLTASCVPFFCSDDKQLRFEFFYLVATLILGVATVLAAHLYGPAIGMNETTQALICSAAGGFLGGWSFDAKWFYRVTARGRNNQHPQEWEPHKFYWRIFIPFLAGLVSFTIYLMASSEVISFVAVDAESSRAAFAFSFVLGYFSDLALTGLAQWAESLFPAKQQHESV